MASDRAVRGGVGGAGRNSSIRTQLARVGWTPHGVEMGHSATRCWRHAAVYFRRSGVYTLPASKNPRGCCLAPP